MTTQPFDFYVVLDFEAAFNKPEGPEKVMEIIEFPSVLINAATLKIASEFQRYVKPVIYPTMHPMVTELTGIAQTTVEAADTFPIVYAEYRRWLLESGLSPFPPSPGAAGDATESIPHPKARSFALVTCGDWDIKTMLPAQILDNEGGYDTLHAHDGAAHSAYSKALASQWINLKDVFNANFPDARITGMTGMLEYLGLPLVGRHHSGIDDCRNIAAVLVALMTRGIVVDITCTRAALSLSQRLRRATHDKPRGGRTLPSVFPEFHGDLSLPVARSLLTDREAWAVEKVPAGDAVETRSPTEAEAAPAQKPRPKKNRLQ